MTLLQSEILLIKHDISHLLPLTSNINKALQELVKLIINLVIFT